MTTEEAKHYTHNVNPLLHRALLQDYIYQVKGLVVTLEDLDYLCAYIGSADVKDDFQFKFTGSTKIFTYNDVLLFIIYLFAFK